jgi:hypothetical protein
MTRTTETEAPTFTPGPWRLDYGGGYGKGHVYADCPKFASIIGGKPHSIAAAHLPPLYERGGYSQGAFSIMEANAALIVAAPDLLEMTKLLERSLVYEIKKSEREGDDEGARLKSFTLAQCRAVINKAEGR